MEHRELYRGTVPEGAYIISYSDLLVCRTKSAAEKIAKAIYYPLGGSWSSDGQKTGTDAHKIKEAEPNGGWLNETRMAFRMCDGFYLAGTMDRYYKVAKKIEDFKTTPKPAITYLGTNQVETYAFLAINNDLTVESGQYTMIDPAGKVLDTVTVPINIATVANCYSTFILPRFNMIKREIEKLRSQYND